MPGYQAISTAAALLERRPDLERAPGHQHEDHRLAGRGERLEELGLAARQAEMGAGRRLARQGFRLAEHRDHGIGRARRLDRGREALGGCRSAGSQPSA